MLSSEDRYYRYVQGERVVECIAWSHWDTGFPISAMKATAHAIHFDRQAPAAVVYYNVHRYIHNSSTVVLSTYSTR